MHPKLRNFALCSLLSVSFLTACNSGTNTEKSVVDKTDSASETESNESIYPQDSIYHQTAQFLTGQGSNSQQALIEFAASDAYKNYSAELNDLWERSNERRAEIKAWADTELKDVNAKGGTLFYPFSGADFVHVDLFFPKFDNFIMLALETKGSFPDLNQLNKDGKLATYLTAVRKSLKDILQFSFFRTLSMADDFTSELDGNIALFLYFMNITDHEVTFVEPVSISPSGELVVDEKISESYDQGYRYYFKKTGEDKIKTLVYFAMNIQNTEYQVTSKTTLAGLDDRKNILDYLKSQNISATYLKSASYLMHRPSFSVIRNFILDNSTFVLQDDSGIPIQFFPNEKWETVYYGTYTRPINLFKNKHQEDLKLAYLNEDNNVKKLPFGIGYQYRVGTSNMQLMTRK